MANGVADNPFAKRQIGMKGDVNVVVRGWLERCLKILKGRLCNRDEHKHCHIFRKKVGVIAVVKKYNRLEFR